MRSDASRSRSLRRWASLLAVVGTIAATIATTNPVGAAITSPTADQVVRDRTVPLVEDTGGQYTNGESASLCALLGRPANSTITVTEVATGNTVFTASKGGPGPWTATLELAEDAAPGLYRVSSSAVNRRLASALSRCVAENVTFPSVTFEYRPWAHTFRDVFGGGSVSMNLTPPEFGFRVGSKASPVLGGGQAMTFFAAPSSALLMAPADLGACAADPSACVPSVATRCEPRLGCEPRFVVINRDTAHHDLLGVFDLDTGGFVARATTGGATRVLASTGSDNDAALRGVLRDIDAAAREQGLALGDLLGSTVTVTVDDGRGATEIEMSVLEALQISQIPNGGRPTGAQLSAPVSVQAGLVIHTFTYTYTGDVDPGSGGYVVKASELAPSLPGPADDPPSVSPALVDMGGPLVAVSGHWPAGAGSHTTGGLNVDSGPGEPNGYPLWLPVVSGTGSAEDAAIDFVGHAVVVNIPIDIGSTHIRIGVLVADGLALFSTTGPLPVGIGDLPVLWDEQPSAVVALVAQVEAAIRAALADPTVNEVTGAVLPLILDSIGGVPAVPLG